MNEIITTEYWGNTLRDYVIVLTLILLGILIARIFKKTILVRVKKLTDKTTTQLDDYLVESVDRFVFPAIYISIVYSGLQTLNLGGKAAAALSAGYVVALTFYAVRLIANVVRLALESYARRRGDGPEAVKQIGGVILIVNFLVWGVGILFLFDNLGYDVTAIIAGLGVGGIAIALAAQNILGDLFNYFVIFFDRPFEVGDFLVIDEKNGIVDKIGIKTTRIKTLSGEQLVVANSDLTSSRIHNYKKMQRRRIVFSIGVSYETSLEQLKKIPEVLREIVLNQHPVSFDRAHFLKYGDSSLDFEIVYFVEDPGYNVYMDIQQQINFDIYQRFEEMEVEIAFPTRTLYVRNTAEKQFEINVNREKEPVGDGKKEIIVRE